MPDYATFSQADDPGYPLAIGRRAAIRFENAVGAVNAAGIRDGVLAAAVDIDAASAGTGLVI